MTDRALSLHLYRRLYLARRAEELIVKHYPEDGMKTPMHMSMGQEAVSVGVSQALAPEDQIFGSYRSHSMFLAKTDDPEAFFGELYGRVTGPAHGKGGSMHLAHPDKGHMLSSAVVASSIPVAVGTAFASKYLGTPRVACAVFGDGAVEEGVFWESLNTACVMKLPVLFVCEDNGWAIHTPPSVRWGFKRIGDVVRTFECSVFESDTTDVEAIYGLTGTAVQSIRETERPSFLHLKCYRYLDHIGIQEDFDIGYRSRAEYAEWVKRDPVSMQRTRLRDLGYTEEHIVREEQAIDERLKESRRRASEAPFPADDALSRGVFHEAN